jgi:Zn-dependent membrane protease YugP
MRSDDGRTGEDDDDRSFDLSDVPPTEPAPASSDKRPFQRSEARPFSRSFDASLDFSDEPSTAPASGSGGEPGPTRDSYVPSAAAAPRRSIHPRWKQALLRALDTVDGSRWATVRRWRSSADRTLALVLPLMLLLMLLVVLAAAAYLAYQYWRLVRGVAATWPLYALGAAPFLLLAVAQLVGRWYQPRPLEPLPRAAGAWLLERLGRAPDLGVSLAELEDSLHTNAYAYALRVILLTPSVRDSSTAAAYAVAAHELGHALMDRSSPRLSAFSLWCRRAGILLFVWGLRFFFVGALLGSSRAMAMAAAVIGAAALAQLVEVADEVIASRLAMRELRGLGFTAPQLHAARRYLFAAFTTYASVAVGFLLPLLAWPWLDERFAAGLLRPAGPLSGGQMLVATLAAGIVVLGAATAALRVFRAPQPPSSPPSRNTIAVGLLYLLHIFFAAPALALLLSTQPFALAQPWGVGMVLVATSALLALPLLLPLGLLALLPQLDIPASPFPSNPALVLRKISMPASESGISLAGRLSSAGLLALSAPLALLYLRWLLG